MPGICRSRMRQPGASGRTALRKARASPKASHRIAWRCMSQVRSSRIGGSSSINGLIFIRGQHEDFDEWAARGAAGWRYLDVLPDFKRIERYAGGASAYHGAAGELGVSNLRNDHPYCEAWVRAGVEFGLPRNPDFNGATTYGVGSYQLSIDKGWRSSSAFRSRAAASSACWSS